MTIFYVLMIKFLNKKVKNWFGVITEIKFFYNLYSFYVYTLLIRIKQAGLVILQFTSHSNNRDGASFAMCLKRPNNEAPLLQIKERSQMS